MKRKKNEKYENCVMWQKCDEMGVDVKKNFLISSFHSENKR